MGIQGLLPFLKKIHQPVNVAQFVGQTVAIDAYCWLHKGAFSCAEKLAMGEKTDQYVYYCMKYIEYMLKKNVKPILVFDGCHLPSKQDVEKSRREKRDLNRKKAAQLLREGKRGEARECLQRCIDISPEMALELMNACRARGVDCIVAPYEADSQLAYLNKAGIAQIIITEDSDLLLFGCEKVIFKMDHFGNGMMIEKSRLNEVLDIQNGFYTFDKFRRMCILSGCDYLSSLTGIGLAKACKVFKIARQDNIRQLLKKIPTYLKMNVVVPDQYVEGFIQADNTFLYQLCYDPLQRKLVPLNPYTDDVSPDELKYAGPYIPEEKALQIALGNINIYTKQMFADFDPATYIPPKASKKPKECLHMRSIWDKNYRIRPKVGLKETQNIDRPNLAGKEVQISSRVLKKKSPSKRKSQVFDEDNEKSDKELSKFYNDSSISSTVSPEKKRIKRESLGESDFNDVESDKVENKAKLSTSLPGLTISSPRKSKKLSPRKQFFDSLVEADKDLTPTKHDTQIKHEELPSLGIYETESENQEEKENGILSPKRNRFAVLTASKKPRFDLNASKEVKSRFFLDSAQKEGENNSKLDDDEKKVETNEQNPIQEKRLKDKESESTSDNRKTITINSSSSSFTKPNSNGSPSGSAFSWSGFKFSKNKNVKESKSPKSNSGVNKQFKRVVSDSNLKQFLKIENKDSDKSLSQSSFTSGFGSQNNDTVTLQRTDSQLSMARSDSQLSLTRTDSHLSMARTDSRLSIDSDISASQQSSHSDLYSIDSYCMPGSQDLDDFTGSQDCQDSEPIPGVYSKSLVYDKSSLDSDIAEEQREGNCFLPVVKKEPTNIQAVKPVNKSGPVKSSCRVSGLSRGKKSKSSKSSAGGDVGKQQNIKDLFSKFALNKSNVQKLKPSKEEEEDDDVEITAVTPCSQEKSALNVVGGVQRKLLP